MGNKKNFIFFCTLAIGLPNIVLANSPMVGTITKMQGKVQVFSNPGKSVKGPPPHALFEGEYYSVKDADVGDEVQNGNVVRTAMGAMAKVVYENGDQVNVGPGTAYRVFWNDKKAENPDDNNASMRLLYGKMRNVVSKGGPRSNMEIKTANATMGVRGTDFFVSASGSQKKTEVTILRGAVAVKPAPKENATAQEKAQIEKAKPVEVAAGNTAVVNAPPPEKPADKKDDKNPEVAGKKPPAPAIEVREAHQEELKVIEKISVVKADETKVATPVSEEIKKLEQKAVETTLQDIKTADPKLYAEISKSGVKSTEDLNMKAVEKVAETAPPGPKKAKWSDLDEKTDYYNKYFRIVD